MYLNILIKHNLNKALKYTLAISIFFSITLSSLFGATESLTGSHVISPNLYLYGLSFYSAFLAYLIYENSISRNIFLLASNPLLLITGPIPYYFKNISYKSFTSRINYYFPYLIIGIFFVKVISIPLTHFLWMLELQDILSAIFFAFIFEIFIYFNFAGLSLIIYSLAGISGFKIPLNFMQPFSSNNLIEYWRGWHRSLSFILKNLFYKPLRKYGSYVALLTVYISSGLWHGSSINFLIWGFFHALSFI
ncbi:hypothetical protein N9Q34_02405, partial [Gammaproteobacteria bacterium]|nr:hypothetical protein [Gammaproteobacteria bacterium]